MARRRWVEPRDPDRSFKLRKGNLIGKIRDIMNLDAQVYLYIQRGSKRFRFLSDPNFVPAWNDPNAEHIGPDDDEEEEAGIIETQSTPPTQPTPPQSSPPTQSAPLKQSVPTTILELPTASEPFPPPLPRSTPPTAAEPPTFPEPGPSFSPQFTSPAPSLCSPTFALRPSMSFPSPQLASFVGNEPPLLLTPGQSSSSVVHPESASGSTKRKRPHSDPILPSIQPRKRAKKTSSTWFD